MHLARSYSLAIWQFARPRTLILLLLHASVGYAVVADSPPIWKDILLAIVSLTSAYVSAVSINDLSDKDVDAINLPEQNQTSDRPLINHTVVSDQARNIAIGSSTICIVSCALINPWLFIAGAVMIVLNSMYSLEPIRIARRGGIAQAMLPVMYVMFPVGIAAAIAQSITPELVVLTAGLYSLFVGRLFLKDIRDEKGDEITGKLTYLVRHGLKKTLINSGIWSVAGIILTVTAVANIGLFQYIIYPVGILAILGIAWALLRCYASSLLDLKLLWVAVAGRLASMVLLVCLISLIVSKSVGESLTAAGLLFVSAAIFIAGVHVLYDEIQSVTRRYSRAARIV